MLASNVREHMCFGCSSKFGCLVPTAWPVVVSMAFGGSHQKQIPATLRPGDLGNEIESHEFVMDSRSMHSVFRNRYSKVVVFDRDSEHCMHARDISLQ